MGGVFTTEKRPDFQKKCAGQPVSAVSKMASEEWKKLSEVQKAPYQKKYEELKAKFDKVMAAFLGAGGVKEKGITAQRAEKRKAKEEKRAKKDPNAPKRPAGGGYGVFMNENRQKIISSLPKDHKMTDVAKAAGVQWKAMSEAAKKPYEDKFKKKQAEFSKAMEEYKKANPNTDADEEDEEDGEEEDQPDAKSEAAPKKKARKAGA